MNKTFILAILVVILTQINCQTPYDPNVNYNFTWLSNITYNMDKLQLCAVPSADGTHCVTCVNPLLSVTYLGAGVYTFCQLDFPVDNCYAFDYCVNCILCHDGYWLNQTVNNVNYCVPKTRGCLKYDSINQKCVTCMDGWVMNTTVNNLSLLTEYYCMFVPDKNCLQYDSNNTCLQCVSNYVLTNGKCVYNIPNCNVTNNNTCVKCNTNYQLDSTGNCVPIPPILNCQLQVDYTCQSCVAGYSLISNQCIFIIDNCAVVNGQICTQCNSGYYVTTDGKCAPIPPIANCQIQSNFTCTQCNTGYYISNNQCAVIPPIPNCQAQSDFICTQCNSGYYINTDKHCAVIPAIPNCSIQSDFNCTQCATGYTLSSNTCIVVITNCIQVAGLSCTKCSDGYQITSSGQCQLIPNIPNCVLQDSNTCSKCDVGYDIVNNTCIYHIDNCKTILGIVCQQCVDGYVLGPDGKCTGYDPFANFDPNCRLYDNSVFTKCLTCSGGFFINSNGKCEQVDPLCKTYNQSNGLCLSCYDGFTLDTVNGKCNLSILIPANSSTLNNSNCNQYDFVRNVCVKCAEGCYFDNTGKCLKYTDINCKTPSADLKSCTQCYLGYTYDSVQGKCIASNYNCATWKNGKCDTCPKGYYLDSNFNCTLIDPNCKIFNPGLKICLFCYPGFIIDTDLKCKNVTSLSASVQKYSLNCASFNQKNQCINCYNGYYLTQDANGYYCQKVSDLCKAYNNTTGKCTSCYLGYYLTTKGDCQTFF